MAVTSEVETLAGAVRGDPLSAAKQHLCRPRMGQIRAMKEFLSATEWDIAYTEMLTLATRLQPLLARNADSPQVASVTQDFERVLQRWDDIADPRRSFDPAPDTIEWLESAPRLP